MTPHRTAALALYAMAADAASVAAPAWLRGRVRRGKEDPDRWPERLARGPAARPPGRLAWLHGVSVGEALSLLPLAARLRRQAPDVTVLVTSGTRASAELLRERLPAGALHQYAPLDFPGAARRFLDHWRPEVGVFVESELWPNLILEARSRGVRLALVSARVSARSLEGWRRAPGSARAVLGAFDLVLARDGEAGARLAALGARVAGEADLKFGAAPLPADPGDLADARQRLGERPVVLAASTHPGEDAHLLKAFAAVRRDDRSLLIVAPRHPDRGRELAELVRDLGLAAGRRGAGDQPGDAAVYVADTLGELGLWYRLSSLAFLGGSLPPARVGGHNPLEPARLGCPFIAGPAVDAWPIYGPLVAAGATELAHADRLAGWFARAIDDPASLTGMADRARDFVAHRDAAALGAADQVLALLAR
jgi:3-deoxy-D-manno-octulosonic-acid transferase